MLKRTITGAVYALFIFGFFLLREVDYRLFALLIYLFSIEGTLEIARALKPYLVRNNYDVLVAFGVAVVPLFCIFDYVIERGLGCAVLVVSLVLALIFAIICRSQKKSNEIIAANILGYFYPAVFIVALLLCNDLGRDKGFIALLFPFVVSALSDTFAYFTGSLIGGKKLCPRLSPNKTWSGAIGGTIGGMVGAVLIYFIFNHRINLSVQNPLLFFIIVGFFSSIFNVLGDLFESSIKRKVGIKDMGNILPGHGGVLDRIDGLSFVAMFVFLVFLFV